VDEKMDSCLRRNDEKMCWVWLARVQPD
jgi:hypothetical protein